MGAVANRVEATTQKLGLSQEEVGRIVGTSGRTVARWLAGAAMPQPMTKQLLLELAYVADELSEVVDSESASVWIFSPNRLLGGDSPADRIHAGDFKTVLALIEALADGVVV